MRRFRWLIVGVAVLAACGDGTSTSTLATTTTSTPASTTTSEATTSTQPTTTVTTAVITTTTSGDSNDLAEGSGCTPAEGPLPDGQWFGFVTARSEDSLDFDLACWFTGAGAIRASAEDGEESPPPNDYYVRNASTETRSTTVGELVQVVFFPDGDPGNMLEVDYDDWPVMVADRGFELGVWLVVEDGAITEIHEQWVP